MKALECINVLSVFWTLPAIYGIDNTEWQASNCINSTSHHVMNFQSKISAYLHLKDTMVLTANPHHLKHSTSLFKNQYTLIASLPLTYSKFRNIVKKNKFVAFVHPADTQQANHILTQVLTTTYSYPLSKDFVFHNVSTFCCRCLSLTHPMHTIGLFG